MIMTNISLYLTNNFLIIIERRSELHSSVTLFTTLCIAQQNLSIGVNVVREGSPSRMRIVLLISFGITTLPKSSILLTIPVAFIYTFLLNLQIVLLLSVFPGEIYRMDLLLK